MNNRARNKIRQTARDFKRLLKHVNKIHQLEVESLNKEIRLLKGEIELLKGEIVESQSSGV